MEPDKDTWNILIVGGKYYDWGLSLDETRFVIPVTDSLGVKCTEKQIHTYIKRFLKFASKCWVLSPECKFQVCTKSFTPEMFTEAMEFPNIEIPPEYLKVLSPYYYRKMYARKQLSKADVKEIKQHMHLKNAQLAQKYCVSTSLISQIRTGKVWADIEA